MPVARPGGDFPWNASQRKAVLLLLAVLAAVFAGRYACNQSFIDDPQPEAGARSAELANRLDPNTADWRELAAIPQLGEKKAQAIVEFREGWLKKHPNDPPFRGPQDLRLIKGIGPATVSNMLPYLLFPNSGEPTTQR
ncbi:MAG TPA: helix-hairpin-helix domain-containing protein [Tepidisphaeraceae bacterium]|jgi:DNA uptake protein ComE-like DNA-binding protein|nr:helix-hairpin-helix domain-containing protein [Tepidisphaeraceae bacterium]